MSKEHDSILYAGTPFFLRCILALSDLVTIPVIVKNQWTRNDISIPSGLATISEDLIQNGSLIYIASLYFNPLDDDYDSGNYHCNIVVLSNYQYVCNSSIKANTTLQVQSKYII